MQKLVKKLSLIILISVLLACTDEQSSHSQKPVQPDKQRQVVYIGAPQTNLPPYFIRQGRTGIEQDILQQVFEKAGYNPKFIYINDRKRKFHDPTQYPPLDCISTVTAATELQGFFSDDVINYQDVAISLKKNNLKIETKADLADKVVEAFGNARYHLGIEEIVAHNIYYHEHTSKPSQIILLYRNRVQVVLMEKNFFAYYRKKVKNVVDISQPVEIHSIFKPSPYKIVCKDAKVRNDFNEGLTLLWMTYYGDIVREYTAD